MRLLESAGYLCMKAGASLGVFDVIGISRSDFIAVQVKSNRWASEAEMRAFACSQPPTTVSCRVAPQNTGD